MRSPSASCLPLTAHRNARCARRSPLTAFRSPLSARFADGDGFDKNERLGNESVAQS